MTQRNKTIIASIILAIIGIAVYCYLQQEHDLKEDPDKPVLKQEADDQKEIVKEQTQLSSWDEDARSGKGITAIGDSVILGVASYLENILPGIVIDGKVGRQMTHAQEVIDELKVQGKLGDQIIIELGTNGPFNKEKLRNLLYSLSDVEQIFLVNTRVPKEWQDTVNKSIEEVAEDFSNTTVVDWYSASEGKDDYFTQDGVHLQPKGAKYYASIIAEAVKGTSQ
ncbi:SGNH/GDSL hydrolase family protein [Lysinibacillus parviboronicapiens]|uniref:SGNH/GDSL hydrolase family protein n=1 Tax=Lysinibacillus parviboronicapiens TaxID=436516 RepID=UPI0006D24EBE|nr:hypothetical protein [Lysinibacillus parviboronicapiens]